MSARRSPRSASCTSTSARRDGEQARKHVRVGDVAVIDAEPIELLDGRLASRALDNRIGSYVALEAARLVAEAGGSEWELAAVAATQEETTFGGSRTSAFSLEPDAAIVLDVTHATDAPGIEVKEMGKHPLGSGPVVSRGSTLNPGVFELLHDDRRGRADPVHDRGDRTRDGHRRGRRAPQPRRRADGRSCRSRCATCTRPSSSSSSRTSRTPPSSSPPSRSRCGPTAPSRAD